MKNEMPADRRIFLHLHKTGGSTIHELLKQHLPANLAPKNRAGIPIPESCMMYPVISGHVTAHFIQSLSGTPRVFTLVREPRERLLSQIYFLKSYTQEYLKTYDNPTALLRIKRTPLRDLLRDREQMEWARDYYVKRLDPLCDVANSEASTPDIDRAITFLKRCIVVGVTERLEAFVRAALPHFGISTNVQVPFVNRRQDLESKPGFEPVKLETISGEEEAVITELTRKDQQLYAYALNVAPQ